MGEAILVGPKSFIKKALFKLGYRLSRISEEPLGHDPLHDMKMLTQAGDHPTVFDVGANAGQSVTRFRDCFKSPTIHSFEPGSSTFRDLKLKTAGIPRLYLNNVALGSCRERRVFNENSGSDMSSFLELGKDAWGTVTERREVEVDTVDAYCGRTAVTHIDILKSDTQGFDFEVLKGARGMFGEHRIHLVFFEVTFCEMYKGLPRFDEIYRLLAEQGLVLVSFYAMEYRDNRAGWTDALFVDPAYRVMA
jgi:FkbM family methyltransferase